MDRIYRAVLVATFCALLCVPGITMIGWPETPWFYGVKPVNYPPFEASYSWLSKFEDYFVANLGHKRSLVQLHNALGYFVLHDLQSDSVLVGRENWLYLLQNHGWESFRSERPLSEPEKQAWRRTMEGAQQWLARRNIAFLFVVVPSKETMYPEFLPGSATRAREVTRLDEVLSVMRSAGINHLDLRSVLREAKQHAPVYDAIDSHWNGLGARAGASAIMNKVAELLHRPASFADLNARLVNRESDGDLVLLLSLDDKVKTPSVALVPNQPRARRLEPPANVLKPTREQLRRVIFEVADESLPKALILNDSFAEALMPTLAEKFQRSVWVWTHSVDLRLVQREQPDIVIMELTERFLSDKPPRLHLRGRR